MDKAVTNKQHPINPPVNVIKAVKDIEKWVSSQTDRDDWAIGGIACRKGFERLLKTYKNQ
jgi:hypothetical protein